MVEAKLVASHPLDDLLRTDRLPYYWCPGCGIGTALGQVLRGIKELEEEGKIDRRNIVWIAGIGCTGRSPGLVKLDGAHVLHGRPVPFAIGVKLANPRLMPLVFSGDGDIAEIGGNHLLHAARKNFDIMVVMVNNFTFALTGGQLGPTTPQGVTSTTTPYGSPEYPLDVAKFIASLNVNYVARWSVTHLVRIKESFKKAFVKRGFKFIEILSQCPEIFGRHIGYRRAVDLYNYLKKIAKIRTISKLEDIVYDWNTEITCGEFVDRDLPGYFDNYYKLYRERGVIP